MEYTISAGNATRTPGSSMRTLRSMEPRNNKPSGTAYGMTLVSFTPGGGPGSHANTLLKVRRVTSAMSRNRMARTGRYAKVACSTRRRPLGNPTACLQADGADARRTTHDHALVARTEQA